jgi:O-antigen/teichoic acid export membrane protein
VLKRLLELLADTLAYGVSGFLAQIVGFLLLPLYTRELSPADYGILAMLAILPTAFQVIASAGTKSAVFKYFYAAEPESRGVIITTAAARVVVATLLVWIVSELFYAQIGRLLLGSTANFQLVQIALCSAALSTLNEIPIIALRAARRAKTVGLLNLLFLCISIALNVTAVIVLQWGVKGLVLAGLVAAGLQLVISTVVTQSMFARQISFELSKKMARYSLPFLPHRLQAAAMGFVAEYSIRTYLGLADAGLYSVALKFAAPLAFISGSLQQAWVPYKFKAHAEEKDSAKFFRSFFNYYLFFLLYLWIGISAWGPEAVRILTATEFHAAAYFVWATAMVVVSRAIPPILSVGIELSDSPKLVPIASFCALVVIVMGSLILVPQFGVVGAAFASSLSSLTLAAGYYFLGQRNLTIRYEWGILSMLLLCAISLVGATVFVQGFALWTRVGCSFAATLLFPALGLLILYRSPREAPRMKATMQRLLKRLGFARSASLGKSIG